jgi:adenylate kinase
VRFAPPKQPEVCDECKGPLAQRDDDREEVVRLRIEEYRSKTEPLLTFYREQGLLREVDGVGTPEEVRSRMHQALRPGS